MSYEKTRYYKIIRCGAGKNLLNSEQLGVEDLVLNKMWEIHKLVTLILYTEVNMRVKQ